MFCQMCGRQNPDGAAFCEGCGAPLAAAAQPTQPAAPAGNDAVNKLLNFFKRYFTAPQNAAAAVAYNKDGLLFGGILAGVNILAIFFFLWRFVGAFITKCAALNEEDIADFIEDMEITYPIFPMLLAALAIAVIGLGATILVKFLIATLNKEKLDIKQLCIEQVVHTIIPSALLVLGILLSFLAWWFMPVVLAIIVVLWVVNLCSELNLSQNHLIVAGVIAVVLVVAVLLTGVLANWSLGQLTYDDETVNESIADSLEYAKDNDTVYNGKSVIFSIIETLIKVDYR